jgi:hypothetical protein
MIHVVYVQADDIKHEAAEQEFKATSLTGKKKTARMRPLVFKIIRKYY